VRLRMSAPVSLPDNSEHCCVARQWSVAARPDFAQNFETRICVEIFENCAIADDVCSHVDISGIRDNGGGQGDLSP
jgi:hypothetical protein